MAKTIDTEPVPDRDLPPPTGGATTGLIDEARREQHEDERVWRQIAAALRRDWEETHVHVFPSDAAHAEENGGPERSAEKNDAPWTDVEPAIRFGHDAVTRYPDDDRWTDDLEARLRDDWTASGPAMPWATAGRMVRYGWDYRRKRML